MLKRFTYFTTGTLVTIFLLTACSPAATSTPVPEPTMTAMPMATEAEMDMSSMGGTLMLPAGMAYVDGQEIRFMHTEVSDPGVADVLTKMIETHLSWWCQRWQMRLRLCWQKFMSFKTALQAWGRGLPAGCV